MNAAETAILDSGMFTLVDEAGHDVVTYVNKSRGAVAVIYRAAKIDGAKMYFDRGASRYYCGGFYDPAEITGYVLPVIRSDKAWAVWYAADTSDCDFTVAIDYA